MLILVALAVLIVDRVGIAPTLGTALSVGYQWLMLLAGVALLIGAANVLALHLWRVQTGQRDWVLSLILVAVMVAVFVAGVVNPGGGSGPLLNWVFDALVAPAQAALFAEHFFQVDPVDILHGEIELTVLAARVIELDDVGVFQFAQHLDLALEPGQEIRLQRQGRVQEFDGGAAHCGRLPGRVSRSERGFLGQVDMAHGAMAEFPFNDPAAKPFPDHEEYRVKSGLAPLAA